MRWGTGTKGKVKAIEPKPEVRNPRWRPVVSKVVYASAGSLTACNTHALCAERRLIMEASRLARQMSRGCTVYNMRRVLGRRVKVERYASDGTAGCSLPCEACRRALASFGAVVVCVGVKGESVRGKAADMSRGYAALSERTA